MFNKILVFDVETPNSRNNRICSIGLSCIDNGVITKTYSIFVNPECSFDVTNVNIHGITPDCVSDCPSFPIVWQEIRSLFFDRIIVAHNANFDLSVLNKTLSHYDIVESSVKYIDTLPISSDIYPSLPNHKLNTLCSYLSIPLNHHNASSDSEATAKVFLDMVNRGVDFNFYLNTYIFHSVIDETKPAIHTPVFSANSLHLLELKGILSGITADDRIDQKEFSFLLRWVTAHTELMGNYPYDAVYCSVMDIIEDGIVEECELNRLLNLCNKLIDPIGNSYDCDCSKMRELSGKNIVLSGEFIHGTKSEISARLTSRGATIQNSVTKKTNIVLVGDNGNDAWVAGNYGTKVKKAMELQSKGSEITIIRESDFFAKDEQYGR